MKEQLTIVKVGGAVIDDGKALQEFLEAFAKIEGKKILVHGGGKVANQLAESLGLKVNMIEGRRVTDDEMLEVVIMAYSAINSKITAQLSTKGAVGVGLTGADGNTIKAVKRPIHEGLDFGWVGDIKMVNCHLLNTLLHNKIIPVIAPLTLGANGQLLNTNADTIASELAVALSEYFDVALNFTFDQKGVLTDLSDPKSLLKRMSFKSYQALRKSGHISGGMVPKLDNAFNTIEQGVKEIRLLNVAALSQLKNPDYDEFTSIH